jgi:hypothetical protein
MLRLFSALALAFTAALVPLSAQVYTIQPRPIQVDNKPRGSFSLSYRYGSAVNVRFEDVGTIASLRDIGDLTSEYPRGYDDGFVTLDTRGGTGSGSVADDGRTNRWAYAYSSQVTPEGDVAFHAFSSVSNGTDVNIDSGSLAGFDMQYDLVVGVFGPKLSDRAWTFTWGASFGGVFSPVNAKMRGEITANLLTTTDIYSLEGAAVPTAPYTAPSTMDIQVPDASGNLVTVTVDNTTLLNNRPYLRTSNVLTTDGAAVDGFWQVKGAYYTARAGPWFRWQFGRHLSLRATAGATVTYVGTTMEYDEIVDTLQATNPLRGGESTTPDKDVRYGYFGAIDAEWWLTERTGFFLGATIEDTGDDVSLTSGSGRRAVIELPNGTGFRAGISVLF